MIHLLFLLFISAMLNQNPETSVHNFAVPSLMGQDTIKLSSYEGKVLLIVNTASKCGFTRQYEGLQNLHEKFEGAGFAVIGFPAANFGGQEFDDDSEIAEFCEVNFGVTFPLSSRVSVRGDDKHELFEMLTNLPNPDFTGDINWNFEKFLIDQNGNLVRRFRSNVEPESEELIGAIESLLAAE